MLVDGLQCGTFNRTVFEELRAGGVSCVTNTIGFWDTPEEALQAIADWYALEREHGDLIQIATTTADIAAAEAAGRTAVLLGSQNSSLLGDRLDFVEVFARLGLRVMQLTYNIQNTLGGSCYEQPDSGLSRFGRNVVAEMNRCGVVVDLSHVGERTSLDAIEASEHPVAVTHSFPREFVEHPRNKSRELLDALAARGGVIGLSVYPNITGEWSQTLEKWCELVARIAERIGVEHVAIGSDLGRFIGEQDLVWMRQGRWSREQEYGAGSPQFPGVVDDPEWCNTAAQLSSIADGLGRAGFSGDEVGEICGGNWLRVYRQVIDRLPQAIG